MTLLSYPEHPRSCHVGKSPENHFSPSAAATTCPLHSETLLLGVPDPNPTRVGPLHVVVKLHDPEPHPSGPRAAQAKMLNLLCSPSLTAD